MYMYIGIYFLNCMLYFGVDAFMTSIMHPATTLYQSVTRLNKLDF